MPPTNDFCEPMLPGVALPSSSMRQVSEFRRSLTNLQTVIAKLTDLVRLPNGELQDDVSIALCVDAADRFGVMREMPRHNQQIWCDTWPGTTVRVTAIGASWSTISLAV